MIRVKNVITQPLMFAISNEDNMGVEEYSITAFPLHPSLTQRQDADEDKAVAKKHSIPLLVPLQIPEHLFRIKARASLRDAFRHIPMPADSRTGRQFHQTHQQKNHLLRLLWGTGIGGSGSSGPGHRDGCKARDSC